MHIDCSWRRVSQWIVVTTVCIMGVGQLFLPPPSFVHCWSFLYLLEVISIIILPYCGGVGSPHFFSDFFSAVTWEASLLCCHLLLEVLLAS